MTDTTSVERAELTIVEQAELTIQTLEQKHQAANARLAEITQLQQQIAYAAANGDKKAKTDFGKLNIEHADLKYELSMLDSALVEARNRLGTAEQFEAKAADEAKALKIQELAAAFLERLDLCDEACATIATALTENKTLLSEMHRLGVTVPGHDIVRIMSTYALKTMLMGTPIHPEEFSHKPFFLAPSERQYFRRLAQSWGPSIERQIEHRLPKKKGAA